MRKILERYKSHVTPSPQNASRSNDNPNSKTKYQMTASGLKNVPAEIKKGSLLSNALIELN